MCTLAKVDVLSFWKKYQPRAPILDKISAAMLLEGFRRLVGQSLPPIYSCELIIRLKRWNLCLATP
jgi:hypothetical protein